MSRKTILNRNNTNFSVELTEALREYMAAPNEMSYLKYHQRLVVDFFKNVEIKGTRGLLINHLMGTGKTIQAIAIIMEKMKERKVIVIMPKSLIPNFRANIRKYVKLRAGLEPGFYLAGLNGPDLEAWIDRNFSFVVLLSGSMIKQIAATVESVQAHLESQLEKIINLGPLNDRLVIVDEAQNLFRAITNGSKTAMTFYEMVMDAKNMQLIFLSGTPISNSPFELVACFNMLTGGLLLPEVYEDFNKMFVDEKAMSIKNKAKFQNRIFGLVSFVDNKSLGDFPEEIPMKVEFLPMTKDQYALYLIARDKEKLEESRRYSSKIPGVAMTKGKSEKPSSYRQRTRQISNFPLPRPLAGEKYSNINPMSLKPDEVKSPKLDKLYANVMAHKGTPGYVYSQFVGAGGIGIITRYLMDRGWVPHPLIASTLSSLRGEVDSGPEIEIAEGRDAEAAPISREARMAQNSPKQPEKQGSGRPGKYRFLGSFELLEPDFEDVVDGGADDRATGMVETPEHHIGALTVRKLRGGAQIVAKFGPDIADESIEELEEALTKFAFAVAPKTLVFEKHVARTETEVAVEFLVYWKLPGITGPKEGGASGADAGKKLTFAVISGQIPPLTRGLIVEEFNKPENIDGSQIALIITSSTGAEGLDLKGVGHQHIFEPYWVWSRIEQIKARGIRSGSHVHLPANRRKVATYLYVAVRPFISKDEKLLQEAIVEGDVVQINLLADTLKTQEEMAAQTGEPESGKFVEEAITTDLHLYMKALSEHTINSSFLDAIREVSIECGLGSGKNCRVCAPTNTPLFISDIEKDLLMADNCLPFVKKKVTATPLEFEGKTYYYVPDPSSLYDVVIYEFDDALKSYKKLPESEPVFQQILTKIGK